MTVQPDDPQPDDEQPVRRVFNRYHGDAPPGSVYIGRGGAWGNRFVIGPVEDGKHGDRDQVIARHRQWLLGDPAAMGLVRNALAGRTLICFCYPKPCHGDTLAEIANMPDEDFERLVAAAS